MKTFWGFWDLTQLQLVYLVGGIASFLLITLLFLLLLYIRTRADRRGVMRLWEVEKISLESRLAQTLQQRDAALAELNSVSDELAQCQDNLVQADISIAVLTRHCQ